ncbi:MAG: DoxX family protein [Steroidobacteraceae bacterium]
MTLSLGVVVAIRFLLVALFLPFSALDKILNFRGAVAQAMQVVPAEGPATVLILAGLAIEIVMPLAILSGIGDRVAAVILAGYCGVTALLWKPFWRPGDFWRSGKSEARDLFWDFLKNFSLAGGFLLITFGTTVGAVGHLIAHPAPTTHPYTVQVTHERR